MIRLLFGSDHHHRFLGGRLVLRELDNDAVRSSDVRVVEPGWFSDRLAQYANPGIRELHDRGIDVCDAEAEVGDTESMAVRPVSSLGWRRRGKPTRKATENQDLPAECKEYSSVAVGIGVAKDRLRFEVMRIKSRRLLRLGGVDVDVIE